MWPHTTKPKTKKERDTMMEITEFQLREAVAVKASADEAFRTALKSDPKATVEGLVGTTLPAGTEIRIVEDTDAVTHLVIPPANTDELSDEQLEAVAGGFLDAKGIGSSVLGDGMFCLGGGLINSKMEINL